MSDLIERLLYATKDPVTGQRLDPGVYGYAPIEDLEEAAAALRKYRAVFEAAKDLLPLLGFDDASETRLGNAIAEVEGE